MENAPLNQPETKESLWSRLWKRKRSAAETNSPSSPDTEEHNYKSPLNVFLRLEDQNIDTDYFRKLGAEFSGFGFFDGVRGFYCEQIKIIARTEINNIKNYIEKKHHGRCEALKSEQQIRSSIKENSQQDYDSKNRYYEKLSRSYQYNPRNFSLLLGVIYGFFTLMLLFADIPLALELTQKGFDFQTTSLTVSIKDFFRMPWTVFQSYWETFLLSIGIAFCTIYIKIYYDEFVGSPIENLVRKAAELPEPEVKKFRSETCADSQVTEIKKEYEIDEQIVRKFNRFYSMRFLIKTAILTILFITICILGFFRYSVNQEAQAGNTTVVIMTFIALTIIFPTISGICASLSLNCIQNFKEYRNAKSTRNDAEKALHEAIQRFNETKRELEPLIKTLEWLENENTIREYEEYLVACYEYGYESGLKDPRRVIQTDLYTMAETFRQRLFVREMSGKHLKEKNRIYESASANGNSSVQN